METFTSGAKSSEVAPRLDLIPLASLRLQAQRMAEGAASHGERNYEKGAGDPVFIRDRQNHLLWHALRYVAGDVSDDHLGAILANAGMLARLEELSAQCLHASDKPSAGFVQAAPRHFTTRSDDMVSTYDEKRAAAQLCLGGCGRIIQNATTCASCLKATDLGSALER